MVGASSLLALCGTAHAQPTATSPAGEAASTGPGEQSRWTTSMRLGATAFLNARSLALPHIVRPSAALGLGTEVMPGLEVGAGVAGIVTADPNYGVWAGFAQGRYQILGSDSFTWGAGLAVGAAHNAPIVHPDLKAELPVVPYVAVSTDALWALSPNTWLGLQLGSEQLSLVHLAAVLRLR